MIWVIIPAFNEEKSIGLVLSDLPQEVDEVIVIDNGSTDETAAEAEKGGATVLYEPRKGYGFACLAGIEHLKPKANQGDIVVFLDGDYSDYPEEHSNKRYLISSLHGQINSFEYFKIAIGLGYILDSQAHFP